MGTDWEMYRKPLVQNEIERAPYQDRFYKALFRASPTPFLILNVDSPRFTILEVNDAYLAVTQTERNKLIGRGLFDVFPDNPDEAQATGERNLRASLELVLESRVEHAMPVQKYDIPRPESQGGGFEERYWSPLNTPVFADGEKMTHIIHYAEDVTELAHMARLRDRDDETDAALRSRNQWLEAEIKRRRSAESKLASAIERERLARAEADSARKVAEEANKYKSAFIAKMSHELRTPLNAIGGYVQLLEMGIRGAVNEEQIEFLRRIRSSEEHLLGLIDQILDIARVESGQEIYQLTSVNVTETIQRVEELVAPQMIAKQIAFSFQSCNVDLAILADADKVRQILLNLLGNALKNTQSGGTISMWCDAGDETVGINVSDTGRGIHTDQIDRIFERFVQISGGGGDGVGLGLPISREFAHGMNGQLTAESVVGHGSTFTLRLPRYLYPPS